jgi:hypothetical protein
MAFIFSIVTLLAGLFVSIIAGTLMGGVVGWTVNLAFPVVTDTLNQLSGLSLSAFDQGAVLGFVGGFIRSTSK